MLDDLAQLQLTPAAAGLRLAQGLAERPGLAAHLLGAESHRPYLLGQRRLCARAFDLKVLQLSLNSPELVLERVDQECDGLLSLEYLGVAGARLGLRQPEGVQLCLRCRRTEGSEREADSSADEEREKEFHAPQAGSRVRQTQPVRPCSKA